MITSDPTIGETLKIAILYQSLRGGTKRLAETLGTNFQSKGSSVGVYPIRITMPMLEADLLLERVLFGLGLSG